eukprot:g3530.t1
MNSSSPLLSKTAAVDNASNAGGVCRPPSEAVPRLVLRLRRLAPPQRARRARRMRGADRAAALHFVGGALLKEPTVEDAASALLQALTQHYGDEEAPAHAVRLLEQLLADAPRPSTAHSHGRVLSQRERAETADAARRAAAAVAAGRAAVVATSAAAIAARVVAEAAAVVVAHAAAQRARAAVRASLRAARALSARHEKEASTMRATAAAAAAQRRRQLWQRRCAAAHAQAAPTPADGPSARRSRRGGDAGADAAAAASSAHTLDDALRHLQRGAGAGVGAGTGPGTDAAAARRMGSVRAVPRRPFAFGRELTRVQLRGDAVTPAVDGEGAAQLLALLPGSAVTSLDLSCNALGGRGGAARALAGALHSSGGGARALRRVLLDFNAFGDRDVALLARAMLPAPSAVEVAALTGQTAWAGGDAPPQPGVAVEGAPASPAPAGGGRRRASALPSAEPPAPQQSPSRRGLGPRHLRRHVAQQQQLRAAGRALGARAAAGGRTRHSGVEWLSLAGNNIGDSGAAALAAWLYVGPGRLDALTLDSNRVGLVGTLALARVLGAETGEGNCPACMDPLGAANCTPARLPCGHVVCAVCYEALRCAAAAAAAEAQAASSPRSPRSPRSLALATRSRALAGVLEPFCPLCRARLPAPLGGGGWAAGGGAEGDVASAAMERAEAEDVAAQHAAQRSRSLVSQWLSLWGHGLGHGGQWRPHARARAVLITLADQRAGAAATGGAGAARARAAAAGVIAAGPRARTSAAVRIQMCWARHAGTYAKHITGRARRVAQEDVQARAQVAVAAEEAELARLNESLAGESAAELDVMELAAVRVQCAWRRRQGATAFAQHLKARAKALAAEDAARMARAAALVQRSWRAALSSRSMAHMVQRVRQRRRRLRAAARRCDGFGRLRGRAARRELAALRLQAWVMARASVRATRAVAALREGVRGARPETGAAGKT